MTSTAYNTAIGRLLNQFDTVEQNNIKKLLECVINRFDDSRAMLEDLYSKRDIDNALGVWLENIGKIIGMPKPSLQLDDSEIFTYTDKDNLFDREYSITQPDADLLAEFKMFGLEGGLVLNDAFRNELADGNMEIFDTSEWTEDNAGTTLTKDTVEEYLGKRCLKIKKENSDLLTNSQSVLSTTVIKTACPNSTTARINWGDGDYDDLGGAVYDADIMADGDMKQLGENVIVDGTMEVTGSDVIVDGDMEAAGVSDWLAISSATLTKDTTNPYEGTQCLRSTYNGISNDGAYQNILTIGLTYRIKGFARGDGVAFPRLSIGGVVWTGTNSTSWQAFDVVVPSVTSTNVVFYSNVYAAGQFVEFDAVEVIQQSGAGGACDDWSIGNNAILSKQNNAYEGSQCLRIENSGTSNPRAEQTITTIGKTYRLTGYVRSDGSTTPSIYDTGAVLLWTGTTSTDWQFFNTTFIAVGTRPYFYALGSSGYVEFDNVVISEINVLADGDMEESGTTDFPAGNSATVSKEVLNPKEGSQVLRIARNGVNNPFVYQTCLIVGKTYRLTGYARGTGGISSVPRIRDSGGGSYWTGTLSVSWQRIDITFIALGTSIYLYSNCNSGTDSVEFDDIQIIAQSVLLDGDMEASGTSLWTALAGATITKETTDPYEGIQNLKIYLATAGNPGVIQYVLIPGNSYKITGVARSDGTTIPKVYQNGIPIWVGTISTSWQEFNVDFIALANDIRFYAIGAPGFAEFDDIQIIDLSAALVEYNPINDAILTKEDKSGSLVIRVSDDGSTGSNAQQEILTIGEDYIIEGSAYGNGTANPILKNGSTTLWTGTSSTSEQTFSETFTAVDTTINLVTNGPIGNYTEWVDIICKEELADGSLRTLEHDYSSTGTYYITVQGEIHALTEFYAPYQPFLSGDIKAFSNFMGLEKLQLFFLILTGDIASLYQLVNLVELYLQYNTSLVYNEHSLPAWDGADIDLSTTGLSSSEVDQFLNDFVDNAGTGGILNLAGTNGARTSDSDTAFYALTDMGWPGGPWSITVN